MNRPTYDILFEYLGSILFENNTNDLNLSEINPDYMDLTQGLIALGNYIRELRDYTKSLSTGNLSVDFPNKNPLCMNLKNLHSNLNHLVWQAHQVANGNYEQKASYLGEFSTSFNQMTEQLKEREALLRKEQERLMERARLAQSYNNILKNLSKNRKEWIFIQNLDRQEITYCSHSNENESGRKDVCRNCSRKSHLCTLIVHQDQSRNSNEWLHEDMSTNRFYSVGAYGIVWDNAESRAYIVEDITKFKMEEEYLSKLAYIDDKTGLFNTRYVNERLEYYTNENMGFTLAFVDIDGLKTVNDTYGHAEGDHYINFIISSIKPLLHPMDTFARIGGDEFLIIFMTSQKKAIKLKLSGLYHSIKEKTEDTVTYKRSFSFGIAEYDPTNKISIEELIKQADENMYQCKLQHKIY